MLCIRHTAQRIQARRVFKRRRASPCGSGELTGFETPRSPSSSMPTIACRPHLRTSSVTAPNLAGWWHPPAHGQLFHCPHRQRPHSHLRSPEQLCPALLCSVLVNLLRLVRYVIYDPSTRPSPKPDKKKATQIRYIQAIGTSQGNKSWPVLQLNKAVRQIIHQYNYADCLRYTVRRTPNSSSFFRNSSR